MEGWLIALLICLVYLLVTLVTGIMSGFRVSKSVTGFVAADRSMNTVVLYFVMGASFFHHSPFWAARGGPTHGVLHLFISSLTESSV